MSLDYYIRVYDNFLSDEECNNICNTTNWLSHRWCDNEGNVIRSDNDLFVSEIDSKYNYVSDRLGEATFLYFQEVHQTEYNLITRGSIPRLNKYTKHQYMKSHVDHIKSLFDGKEKGIPVLSTIVLLNDNFEGGNLLFSFKNEDRKFDAKLKKGSLILWPSNFLFEHEITPIIDGERYSMVTWFW